MSYVWKKMCVSAIAVMFAVSCQKGSDENEDRSIDTGTDTAAVDTNTATDVNTDSNTGTDANTEVDSGTETNSDWEADSNSDTDTSSNTNFDTNSDTDTPLDVDTDSQRDTGDVNGERFSVGLFEGTWSLLNKAGEPVIWRAVNVRLDQLDVRSLKQSDFDAIAEKGFDTVRTPIHWRDLETEPGVFSETWLNRLHEIVGFAQSAGLNIIFDPLHIGGNADNVYFMPDWVWENQSPEDGKVFDVISNHALGYLEFMMTEFSGDPTVVAFELVNEPREPSAGSSTNARNEALITTYDTWIARLRQIDSDKIIVMDPFYGNVVVAGSVLVSNIDASRRGNLMWSLHDYYTGVGDTSGLNDGFTAADSPGDNWFGYASGVRTESWDSSNCYLIPNVEPCPSEGDRSEHITGTRNHIRVHYDAGQEAGMPLLVGEFGIPEAGGAYDGWEGAALFFEDKTTVYDELFVSRAAWAFERGVDTTFGLYDSQNHIWREATDALF